MRQKKRQIKQKSTTRLSLKRVFIWGISVLAVLGLIITTVIFIGRNDNKTRLSANVYAPEASTFNDENTMFFATPNGIPEPNNGRTIGAPDNLIISYDLKSGSYAPAFKMDITNEDLAKQIKITPFIRGSWYLRGDSSIMFIPESQWPAGTKFTVKINSELFNDDVKPDTKRVTFKTPDITAKIDNFNLYTNEADKKSVIAVAVISFNYQIDTKDFKNKVSLKLDRDKLDFGVNFDQFHRTAFIISQPVKILDVPQNVKLRMDGIKANSGDSKTENLNANVTIESSDNIFKISSVDTIVADDTDGNAQQLILINTTTAAQNNINWTKYVNVYLLPKYSDDQDSENEKPHKWKKDEITDAVLSESKKLEIRPKEFITPNGVHQYAFSYDVSDEYTRYIYVDVLPGINSINGFEMKNGVTSIMPVPYPAQTVQIAGSGALLSLAGDRQLGLVARGGVDTAYVNLYKVKSSEINHLISQTYNIFAESIDFKSWAFGVYDMSTVFQKRVSFANKSRTATNYASLDLGDYLDRTYGDNTGIFIIQTGTSENSAEYNDKRLILLTNLGIIRKTNIDSSSTIFVSNLGSGEPAEDIEISVLGRNGSAVWAGRTDADGRANIPALPWSEYKNAREPVAIVARRGSDVAFIPYNAYSQHVEYSKFDIDGNYSVASNPLNAYMFSDRGIYRPGEDIIIGGIIKNKTFKSLSGIPVRFQMYDSRGHIVTEKTFSLSADGMFDIKYKIPNNAPLGSWTAYIYSLTSNDKLHDMLGTVNFNVQEFTPDTMKISAQINGSYIDEAWIPLTGLKASVSLRNLFGTPAVGNRISARATLTPTEYSFKDYSDYIFTPNFISDTGLSDSTARRGQTYSVELSDITTDENGNVTFDIDFNQNILPGTYTLVLNVKGFEKNSGRSVQTNLTARASDAALLIGWHADGNIDYINRGTNRKIKFIAIDNQSKLTSAEGLILRVIKQETQTTLVKDYNNTYKYQTATQDKIVSQRNFDISKTGTEITLDTTNGGTYYVQVIDKSDKILATAEYFIANAKNDTLQTDTNADLQVKLNKKDYAPGDTIEISITSPYTGTGLITIERDKVYSYKWFCTESTSSVQTITVPKDFSGTGYVNVSFVRDIDSKDIFTTPYVSAVAPFVADTSSHEIKINISAPDVIKDNKLSIKYEANKDSRLMIFAINTGILQVAGYKIPNPLAYFFQKAALQVETYQILSLLLPEYKILKEYAKTGGGDYGSDGTSEPILQNPFARNNLPSVAFYSGILNVKANKPDHLDFEIPEYFNGNIKIFAVATNASSVGSAETETLVQSPVIISTSAPLMAAPGDKFEINSVVTNMTESDAESTVNVSSSDGIEIQNPTTESYIPSESEKLFVFNALAKETLGNSTIKTDVALTKDGKVLNTRQSTANISIRPASVHEMYIKSGIINSKRKKISGFQVSLYPEKSVRHLYVSRGADAMIIPLFEYLKDYEYPCSEQIVSRAIPYVLMSDSDVLNTTFSTSEEKISEAINTLKNRQNDDGSFALWSGGITSQDNWSDAGTATLTAYIAEFLTIAQDSGFNVPSSMLSRALDYLRTFAGGTIINDEYANAVSRAIYVISANGYITTSYIDNLTKYANENISDWKSKIMGVYIAAAYKMMKQEDTAINLISKYKLSRNDEFEYFSLFDNNVANDAMYYYISGKYFTPKNPMDSDLMLGYIASGDYSAYTSATVIMAASGISKTEPVDIKINTDVKTNTANIPADATEITIECQDCSDDNPVFYTLLQSGYPKKSQRKSDGIDITREYFDLEGNKITSANLGDTIKVKISARTRGDTKVADNVVITDLLPCGFIADAKTLSGPQEYAEVREDRILIFTDLGRDVREFTYTMQVGTAGVFTIPAITAQSMYNSAIRAVGASGTFTATNENAQ